MVVWIIGLSGSGKSTLANAVVAKVRCVQQNIVLLDGDMIREIFGNDLGHTLEDRHRNADRISQLSKFLEDQGVHVVCAILSLFPDSRSWNRQHIKNYFEVFIDAPIDDLIKRDSKGIYRRFQNGEINNVAGMDIEFPKPDCPDLIIENSASLDGLLRYADLIAEKITNS
ncbi:MAG TPA: adenylyl-sulfate kinase [Deltaproteobacteria bacterium]|nr:adenylyl-sulfate kinase [Deltaproteobacteria bacterium]HPJ92647.1 adenylyl-sulfate kinase [Deltaproteobacteria bacterium]HPR55217.1 adenylyl-sulfate kinase [Deltaproteobacteria bacterium]